MQQEFITVTFNRTKIAIRCADILYVIMSDDHCTIHMFDGSVYRCRMTLKELKKQLNEGFMEVKRGCMIAVSAIRDIGDKILLSNGEETYESPKGSYSEENNYVPVEKVLSMDPASLDNRCNFIMYNRFL